MTDSTEPQVAQLNIGELLSSKRHKSRETLTDVAKTMKLSPDIIEKLEANRFDEIGTPVYVRGYLGLYGKYLGLDGAYIIEQYNLQNPAEEIAIRPSAGHIFGESHQQSQRHSKTLSFVVAGLVVSGLVYGYMQAESYWQQKANKNKTIQHIAPSGESDAMTTAIGEATAAQNLANDVLSGDAINTASPLVTNIELDIAVSPAAKKAEQELAKDNLSQHGEASVTTLDNIIENATPPNIQLESINDGTSNVSEQRLEVATLTDSETVATKALTSIAKISMKFRDKCWVKITDADNKTVAARLYKSNNSLNASGKLPLTLVVGSPSAIRSFKLNGRVTELSDYHVGGIKYRVPKPE